MVAIVIVVLSTCKINVNLGHTSATLYRGEARALVLRDDRTLCIIAWRLSEVAKYIFSTSPLRFAVIRCCLAVLCFCDRTSGTEGGRDPQHLVAGGGAGLRWPHKPCNPKAPPPIATPGPGEGSVAKLIQVLAVGLAVVCVV